MTNEELADLYINLAMKFEEENYVECGFKAATEARQKIVSKIKTGNLSSKDVRSIEPVFQYGGLHVHDYVKAKKRFIFF